MTQGKIERWHQTMKNRVLLENYYLLGDLEAKRRDEPGAIHSALDSVCPLTPRT